MPAHVRKGDEVIVIAGDHKGKVGTVLHVDPDSRTVIVKGVNLLTKNLRRTPRTPQGGVITREAPIRMSKVAPVVDGKPTRVRFQIRPDGSKVRVAVRGGQVLGTVHGPRKKK
jgi:large subunit ribosomal protein L24